MAFNEVGDAYEIRIFRIRESSAKLSVEQTDDLWTGSLMDIYLALLFL
jgi:hypothetical protein